MARSDKPGMIDGFMSVQAVRRSEGRAPEPRPPNASPPSDRKEEVGAQASSAYKESKRAVGHTAMPSRHELVCYSCGYAFVVTGKLSKLFCSKCKEELETGDHTIEGEWTRDIRTVGRVNIKPGAVVKNATIISTDIVIGGDCTNAKLKPSRRIELVTGGRVAPSLLDSHPVLIRPGARIALDSPLRCSDLDIHGELQGEVEPTGLVTIHAGGMLRGKLNAHHLIVHDGGGLNADLHIEPEPPTNPKNDAKTPIPQPASKSPVAGSKSEPQKPPSNSPKPKMATEATSKKKVAKRKTTSSSKKHASKPNKK